MPNQIVLAVERLLTTLWVGAIWAVGYLAAPVLFAALDDRQLAGELAGRMFHIMNIIGFVCAPILAAIVIRDAGLRARRLWVLGLMLTIVAISAFVLQPMMQELKAIGIAQGTDAAAKFGRLHGISQALYLILSLAGAYLVIGRQKN